MQEAYLLKTFCIAFDSAKYYNFIVTCEEGGKLIRSVTDEGIVYVEAAADDGYIFAGYYVNDNKIDPGRFEFSGETEIVAIFKLNQ